MPAREPSPIGLPPAMAQRLAAEGGTFAVTGATGWFGRVTLDLLARALGPAEFARRVTAYASRAQAVEVTGAGTVGVLPLDELEPADTLLHYAFVTRRGLPPEQVDAFVRTNVAITSRVLGVVAGGRVARLFVTSSGAARRPDMELNPYGALKALDELAFAEASRRAGTACVVARVFNVAGAHMTHAGVYALGDLLGRASRGEPLEIAARGDVVRSYVGVEEVVGVALGELLDGRSDCFETAGEEEVEVEQLARTVRRVVGREDLAIVRHRAAGAVPDVYVGDGTRFGELAARHGVVLRSLEQLVAAAAA